MKQKNVQPEHHIKDPILPHQECALPENILIAKTQEDLDNVTSFKRRYCNSKHLKADAFENDGFDNLARVFYAENKKGQIISCSRLLFDSPLGFPEERQFPSSVNNMRNKGEKLAEFGRFLINEDNKKQFKLHFKAAYETAIQHDVDVVLIVLKTQHISNHDKIMSITVLSDDVGVSWDEEQAPLSLIAWDINAAQPKFWKWIDYQPEAYQVSRWDNYSTYHLGARTSIQTEVYQHISSKAWGNVLDAGCGTGQTIPYARNNHKITTYTGVDLSLEMITHARDLKSKLTLNDDYQLVHEDINNLGNKKYDSIMSINSFYAWQNQASTLAKIHDLLDYSGTFFLLTPNNQLNPEKLLSLVQSELIGHPYYDSFIEHNYSIFETAKEKELYQTIDALIEKVRASGFAVQRAHSDFFLGGASYLELVKQS